MIYRRRSTLSTHRLLSPIQKYDRRTEGCGLNWFRFKSCVKCGGDLALDQGDWLCLQCGTYYYIGLYERPGLYQRPAHPEKPKLQPPEPPTHKALGAVPSGPSASLNRSLAPEVNRTYGPAWHTDRVFNATQGANAWPKT